MAHETIGRYEIKQELGRGGMATVYRAYDPSFGREVAIKVLPHAFLHDATFRARFGREARTIAALEHQAIVPVYDFGEQDGQPYLVMRYMPGGSLSERIEQGSISPAETVRLIGQLAPALDDAHEHGVIHRDLKPGNILFDEKGNAYLSDFGIAKVAQESAALTGGGEVIGTPAYMSPEQGRGQVVDRRSDLYSLGVIIFQMLSGRLPYRADTPVGMIYAHVHEPIPDILEANPVLPAVCSTLVGRAMAKDPADRYQTARQLADELGKVLSAPADSPDLAPLQTEPLMTPPTYTPTAAATGYADVPHVEKVPFTRAQMPARQGMPVWARIGGAVVGVAAFLLAVIVMGLLALPGILGGGAEETPGPTRQTAGSTPAMLPSPIPTDVLVATAIGVPTHTTGGRARALAQAGVTDNAGWAVYTEEINGALMALVPAGCFRMGSTDAQTAYAEALLGSTSSRLDAEKPAHQVCFEKPFWIDVYEVTQEQFIELGGEAVPAGRASRDTLPRDQVTWDEADASCHKRGARLPTEAEWEYAARGPDGLIFPWGDEFIADNVVYDGNSGGNPWDVGMKPGGVSWIGSYDQSGNVWEWVADWYGAYPAEQQIDPTGPASGKERLLRGGSCGTNNFATRSAIRIWNPSDFRSVGIGFRCALPYQP